MDWCPSLSNHKSFQWIIHQNAWGNVWIVSNPIRWILRPRNDEASEQKSCLGLSVRCNYWKIFSKVNTKNTLWQSLFWQNPTKITLGQKFENHNDVEKVAKIGVPYFHILDINGEIRQPTIYYAESLGRWDKVIVNQESDITIIIFFNTFYRFRALKTLYFYFCDFIKK